MVTKNTNLVHPIGYVNIMNNTWRMDKEVDEPYNDPLIGLALDYKSQATLNAKLAYLRSLINST